MTQGICLIFSIMNNKDISSLRDFRRVPEPLISINISSLWEYIRKSRRDVMFIEPEIHLIINKSRRDDMFITPWYTTTHHQSHRDDMFVKTIQHINHSTNSPFTHSTNSPFTQLTNSPLNHLPFHQPTPLTYARIL